ncbi:hypothetical protein BVY03_00840 [bacterium K02(2017)]|nr:hypothetical protein BVY03_00840 [bacterium K02(2017)]
MKNRQKAAENKISTLVKSYERLQNGGDKSELKSVTDKLKNDYGIVPNQNGLDADKIAAAKKKARNGVELTSEDKEVKTLHSRLNELNSELGDKSLDVRLAQSDKVKDDERARQSQYLASATNGDMAGMNRAGVPRDDFGTPTGNYTERNYELTADGIEAQEIRADNRAKRIDAAEIRAENKRLRDEKNTWYAKGADYVTKGTDVINKGTQAITSVKNLVDVLSGKKDKKPASNGKDNKIEKADFKFMGRGKMIEALGKYADLGAKKKAKSAGVEQMDKLLDQDKRNKQVEDTKTKFSTASAKRTKDNVASQQAQFDLEAAERREDEGKTAQRNRRRQQPRFA